MPTTIVNSQVENLRQYADGNMVVLADSDHFKVSSNNSFDRLIAWTQANHVPASQTRQITEARGRFITAIGNRYGPEGGAAARDVLGANSTKPLRSRDIKQVFDTLDRKWLGQLPPAPRESATSRASVPSPGDPPGPRENDLVAQGVQQQTPAADPLDDLPPAAFSESDLVRMAGQEHGSTANPLDVPPAAAAPPIDTAAQADPLLEPYQRAGIATEYAQPLLAAGIPPEAAVRFLQRIDQCGDDPKEVFQSGVPLKLLREVYGRPPAGLRQARLLHDAALDASIIREVYAPHQLPLDADTMIRYTDRNVTQAPHKLGRGGFNTVYEVEYDDGKRRIFKPLTPPDRTRQKPIECGWVAAQTGIDPYNPQSAMRNLLTCRLAEELGFDVVVQTELGLHTLPQATQPVLGLVMEVAPGVAARDVPPHIDVFMHAEVRRETTKLQLLDCLTAQGDRHGYNYFIGVRPDNSFKVSGIDNDQCLGSKVHNPDDIRRGLRNKPGRVFRSCGLPPVIDTDMARTFELLTPDRVRQLLGDKLKPAEVDATVHRLSAIKDHIAHLRQEGRVIKPDGWADARVEAYTGFTNSYFQRDRKINLGVVALGNADAVFRDLGY